MEPTEADGSSDKSAVDGTGFSRRAVLKSSVAGLVGMGLSTSTVAGESIDGEQYIDFLGDYNHTDPEDDWEGTEKYRFQVDDDYNDYIPDTIDPVSVPTTLSGHTDSQLKTECLRDEPCAHWGISGFHLHHWSRSPSEEVGDKVEVHVEVEHGGTVPAIELSERDHRSDEEGAPSYVLMLDTEYVLDEKPEDSEEEDEAYVKGDLELVEADDIKDPANESKRIEAAKNPRHVTYDSFSKEVSPDVEHETATFRIEWGLTEADNGRKFVSAWLYDDEDNELTNLTGIPTTYPIPQGSYPLLARGQGSVIWDNFRIHQGGMPDVDPSTPRQLSQGIEDKRNIIQEIRDVYPDGYVAQEEEIDKSAEQYIDELEDKINDEDFDFAPHERVQHRRAVDQLISGEKVTSAATGHEVQHLVNKISELAKAFAVLGALELVSGVVEFSGAARVFRFFGSHIGRTSSDLLDTLRRIEGPKNIAKRIYDIIENGKTRIAEVAEEVGKTHNPTHLIDWMEGAIGAKGLPSLVSSLQDLITGNVDEDEEQILSTHRPAEIDGIMSNLVNLEHKLEETIWDAYYFNFQDLETSVGDPSEYILPISHGIPDIDNPIPEQFADAYDLVNLEDAIDDSAVSDLKEDLNTMKEVANDTFDNLVVDPFRSINQKVNEFADALKSRAEDENDILPHKDPIRLRNGVDDMSKVIRFLATADTYAIGIGRIVFGAISLASLVVMAAILVVISPIVGSGVGAGPYAAAVGAAMSIMAILSIMELQFYIVGELSIVAFLSQFRAMHWSTLSRIEYDLAWGYETDWSDDMNGRYDV